jgi:hypothetical protein
MMLDFIRIVFKENKTFYREITPPCTVLFFWGGGGIAATTVTYMTTPFTRDGINSARNSVCRAQINLDGVTQSTLKSSRT